MKRFLTSATLTGLTLSLFLIAPVAEAQGAEQLRLCIKRTGKSNIKGRDAYLSPTPCRGKYIEFDLSKNSEFSSLTLQQGAQGEKGDTGPQGIQGVQGIQGLPGVPGAQGIQGEKGEKGETGAQGDKGDTGDTGLQGIQGVKGEKGDDGIQGIQGAPGNDGIDGKDGIVAVDSCYSKTLSRTGNEEETQQVICNQPETEFLLNSWFSLSHEWAHVQWQQPIFTDGADTYAYPIGAEVRAEENDFLTSPNYTLSVTIVCCPR